MDPSLHELLRNTRSDDTTTTGIRGNNDATPYTHVSLYGPHARWNIKSSKLTELWQGYCGIVYEGKGNYCLAERSLDNMPVIADCTFRFHLEHPAGAYPAGAIPTGQAGLTDYRIGELYGEDFLLALVYCYQQAMLELLQISDSQVELLCVILESERNWIVDDNITTQFRLQFPYCKTDVTVQLRSLRPRVIQLLRTNNVRGRLPQEPVNDWESIIDPIGPQEPLPMYKSSPHPDRPKLILNRMYGPVLKEHIEANMGPMIELSQVFSPTNHTHVQQGIVSASMFAQNPDLEFWIPMFLSASYWHGVVLPKKTTDTANIKIISPKVPTPLTNHVTDESPLEIAERLLQMLSRDRVENDSFWMDIGKALYTSDSGSESGLNTWIRFTERSDVHTEEECRQLYYSFRNNNISVATIMWYAKEDSPEAFNEWHKNWCFPIMEKATSCLDADVAKALYRVYCLEYKCSSLERSQFWQYKNHRWVRLDHGITLRQAISDDFLRRYEQLRISFCQEVQETTDDKRRESGESMIKKITALIAKLKTVRFKSNVMREAAELFYDGRFEEHIDTNENYMGMLDGVLEVANGHASVRPGKPEDYVTMCTGLPYIKNLSWDHELVQRLMKWMRQVFVDPQLREYFLKMSASCLRGRNSDKIFPIWTGEGDNSKSMIVKLFEAAFGSYCIKFPTSILTGKRTQSSQATPEIARSKGTHIAFAQEPDDEEVMKGGIIKEHTGGDRMPGRDLYKGTVDYDIMYKFIFMCNKVPPIPTGGKAVRNRTLILPFLSTWVNKDRVPQTEEEQYKQRLFEKDAFFERQIPELAQAFIWVLMQYYPKYIEEGLVIPQVVEETTRQYWQENDIYQHFIGECIIRATNDKGEVDLNASITHSDLYREFKTWFKDAFPGQKVPDTTNTRTEFLRILGKQHNRRWHGIRLSDHDNGAKLFPF